MIAVRVLAAAFLIAGLGLLAAGAAAYRDTRAFLEASAVSDATVLEVHRHRSTNLRGKTSYYHVYEVRFTPDRGEPVTAFAGEDSVAEFQPGDNVAVRYRRDAPKSAQIDGFRYLWFKFTALLATGLAALAMGTGNLWPTAKRRSPRTALFFVVPPLAAGTILFVIFGNVVVQGMVFAMLAFIAFQVVRDKRKARAATRKTAGRPPQRPR